MSAAASGSPGRRGNSSGTGSGKAGGKSGSRNDREKGRQGGRDKSKSGASAPASGGRQGSEERADTAAWLAVAAGTIGSFMALLDVSIVNTALPTIQGGIGADAQQATWISTAYLVSEIVMIALAGWFSRLLGLRRFLIIATTAFIVFSVICGLSTSLFQIVIGRVGQGFTGGAMIPTALTIVSTRLPPKQRPIGFALFGFTAVSGPVFGPLIGGYLTEHASWHYAFFINLPVSLLLLGLLFLGLKPEKARVATMLASADWLGIAGLTFGLGALTVVLEEGQTDYWFDSNLIIGLSIVSVIGFILLAVGQFVAKEPVVALKILRNRQFLAVFLISLSVGAALYGMLYLIPQFLSIPLGADYNAEQSGFVVLISGIPPLLMFLVFAPILANIDIRIILVTGLICFAASCFLNSTLIPDANGSEFFWAQVLRGFGQFFTLVFLNSAATDAVAQKYTEDASGLFNGARNLGGSFGLSMVATMQDRRMTFHMARLQESITANSLQGQDYLQQLANLPSTGSAAIGGMNRAVALLGQQIRFQATVMTFNDLFLIFGFILLAVIPLVFFLRPLTAQTQSD